MDDYERYLAAGHAMQTGVATLMHYDPMTTDPKHLRVGVNMALCDNSGLAKLLIAKGIITHEELMASLLKEVTEEVERYRDEIAQHTGVRPVLL